MEESLQLLLRVEVTSVEGEMPRLACSPAPDSLWVPRSLFRTAGRAFFWLLIAQRHAARTTRPARPMLRKQVLERVVARFRVLVKLCNPGQRESQYSNCLLSVFWPDLSTRLSIFVAQSSLLFTPSLFAFPL